MRKIYWTGLAFLLAISFQTMAQDGVPLSCRKTINVNSCVGNCITITGNIPNIRIANTVANDYVINPISGGTAACAFFPPIDPGIPGDATNINQDDRYSQAINLPFNFNFYGTNYNQLVISGNGYISFDATKANAFSHWNQQTAGNVPSTGYDPALAMGVFHDLDISVNTSPTKRIKYDIIGTAPYRKFITSYFKVPQFSCNSLIENTHQIVLYESFNIIEVFVQSAQICASWNQGRKMIGLQNFARNKGIMAPGRASTGPNWGSVNMNEAWRFVPSGGNPAFRGVELVDLSGNVISTSDTTTAANNTLDLSFANVCPTTTTSTYIIKAKYENPNAPGSFVYATDTIDVVLQPGFNATSSTVAAGCANNNIGSFTLTPSGAPGPFEYSLDGGVTWQASNVVNGPAGTYDVIIRVVGTTNCNVPVQVTIPLDPSAIVSSYAIDNILCNGGNSGSITISSQGGSGVFEYSINGGTTYQSSNTFTNLAPGPYNIRIRDNQGCTRDTLVNITEPTELIAAATNSNATCTQNGSIEVTATNGTPGYTYSLDGTTFQSSNVFSVTNGQYVVTVRDDNGCIKTVNQTVALTNDLVLSTISNQTICLGASVQLTTTGTAASYSWTGQFLNDPNIASPTSTPTSTGVFNYAVTGVLGQCSLTEQLAITVDQSVTLNAGPDVTIITGEQVQLNAVSTGATNYTWTSVPANGGLSSTTILNPVANPQQTTVYTLTAVNGQTDCRATDDITITVIPYCIKVNNAFTPNGDGINDLWTVFDSYDCLKNVTVIVFNRYGSKVFESKDYRNNWDGRYNGKSLPDATYYAVIEFTLISGKKVPVKTDLTILR